MILNRLIVPEYNNINFMLNHTENGEKYMLGDGCRYYIIISNSTEPFEKVIYHEFSDEYCSVPAEITQGEYIFEIGVIDNHDVRCVILPALDERLRPLNQLLILRRLNND